MSARKRLTRYERQLNRSRDRFASDTAKHQMTVLHDDGLYRHLRFAQPAPDAWHYWFEIVTWPGSLAIRGDFGDGLMFTRITDMFAFFRNRTSGINPDYWAEKLAAGRKSVKEYDESLLRAEVFASLKYTADRAKDERDDELQKTVDKARELIHDAIADGTVSYESGARDLLSSLEHIDLVSDTWEWDLTDYPWWYLWACHAIVWGIRQYDAAKAAEAGEPS